MRSLLNRVTDQRILLTAIILSLPIKLSYVLTRNLFPSGPDADTYLPASIDYSNQGFFSSSISGMPYWPAGYPWLNSLTARLTGNQWEETTQILQVMIFSLACVLYFKLILPYFGRSIALLSSLTLILQPAWVVANGEAMYETHLFSFIIIGAYLTLKSNSKVDLKSFTIGLLFLGFAVVIHPRILPIVMVFLVILHLNFKYKTKAVLIGVATFASLPILFAFRNLIAEGSFTLSTALVGTASSYNVVFRNCSNLECIPMTIFNNFPSFLSQGITNLNYFFSPHWGPDARGTWFHNLSGLFLFPNGDISKIIISLGRFVSSISVFLLFLGIWRALLRRNLLDYFFVISSLIFLGTAFMIFGDNRHRLIASLSLLPLQLLGSKVFWYFLKNIFMKTATLFK
jgi:hypothetical protein